MTIKKILSLFLLAYFLVLFTGGMLIQFLNPEMFKDTEWAPPTFILVASLLCLVNQKKRTIILLLLAGLIGFFSEIMGIITTFPYGEYSYTSKLGIKIFDVPLVLICSWIIVTNLALDLISFLKIKKIFFPFVFSFITTFYDLLIDPLMSGPLNYWVWKENSGGFYGVPFENFFGWFLVSLFISILPWKAWNNSFFPISVNLLLPIFFITTSLTNKLYIPAIIGIILIASYVISILRSNSFKPDNLA
jgi:putative membrane protein